MLSKAKQRDLALVMTLVILQLGAGLIYLKTVPRYYMDEAWESSLGYTLAREGTFRHGIIEGWGGMHVHFVQNQLVQAVVLAGVYRLAGMSLWTGRLASLAVSALAVAAIFFVLARWFDSTTAFAATLATILYPWFFEVSRRVRPEIYYLALAFCALWQFQRAVDIKSRWRMVLAGFLAGLACLAHPTGAVLVAALAAGVILGLRCPISRRQGLYLLLGFLLPLAAYGGYVLYAVQDPRVDFFAQMRGRREVMTAGWRTMIGREGDRWAHFLQWPKGILFALFFGAAWVLSWYKSTRADKAAGIALLVFTLALPFTTVNTTSRYLVATVPLLAVLMVRLVRRISFDRKAGSPRWTKLRLAAGVGIAGVYMLMCLWAIFLMVSRLRGADFDRVVDRISAVTGPTDRVYGSMAFWMARDRLNNGPFPLDENWEQTIEMVRPYDFRFAVRTAVNLNESGGITPPPPRIPPFSQTTLDQVCRRFGTKVLEFRDPDFGPIEVYKLHWDRPSTIP